jgi:hypothetical protein
MPWDNNGTSITSQRPSRVTFGNLTHLTSNQTEAQLTSDAPPQTADGGNCSNIRTLQSLTRKAKFWRFKVMSIKRTETSVLTPSNQTPFTNNGISSMLMSGRASQSKVSLTRNSVSMSRDHSMLSHR